MTAFLTFHPIVPIYWIISTSMLLLIIFGWLEIKRKLNYLPIRQIALLTLIVGLVGLFTNPSIQSGIRSTTILITENYTSTVIDSLIRTHEKAELMHSPEISSYRNSKSLKSWRALTTINSNLIIHGNGVPLHARDYLINKNYKFIPGPLPNGIIAIGSTDFKAGNFNTIYGIYNNGNKNSKLVIEGPNGVEDSITFTNKGENSYALSINTKQPGIFTYTVKEFNDSNEIISTNRLPVTVAPSRKLSILFLLDYPTAEVRFLKNQLSEQGHIIQIRYQVSTNRYRYEYANTNRQQPFTINPALLASTDLVITDRSSLDNLSKNESRSLFESIKDGLGLLILMDDYLSRVKNSIPVTIQPSKTDTAIISLPHKLISIPKATVTVPDQPGLFKVLTTKNDEVIAGYVYNNYGKVGIQLIKDTYTLILSGDKETHKQLWIPLINNVSRNYHQEYEIRLANSMPWYANDPIEFDILASEKHPTVLSDGIQTPLLENWLVDNWWHGKTWFNSSGWHQLVVPSDSTTKHVFISNANEWESLRMANQNKLLIRNEETHELKNQPLEKRVNPLVFYFLFLLGAGLLWVVPKL